MIAHGKNIKIFTANSVDISASLFSAIVITSFAHYTIKFQNSQWNRATHDEIQASSDEIFGVPPQMKLNPPPLTLRSKISSRSDFTHDSGFIPTKADLVEKSTHCLGRQVCAFFWWGMVDSDHRSQWQQIYSLPPLAAREIPQIVARLELANGVEPSTAWLQIRCSAIEPHQQL